MVETDHLFEVLVPEFTELAHIFEMNRTLDEPSI